jgi:hypothetical protein
MKPVHVAAWAVLGLLLQPAFAEETKPAAPTTQSQSAAPTPAEVDKQLAKMQELITKMNDEMTKIRQTQDPAERQKLLQEHWATMQNAMTLMHGTWGAGMGGGMMGGHMMGGPMMWGNYENLTPEQLKQRQYMMERWMPMQQMMMSHMMQQQYWMMPQPGTTPPSTPAPKK